MHDGDALDRLQRDLEVVLDQHEAHVPRERGQQQHELAALGGREARGGLVEEDEARGAGERHADLELALLAVRERGDGLVGDVREADALEELRRWRRATGARRAGAANAKRPRLTPRIARKRLSRTVSSRNSSEDWYVRRRPRRMRSWGGRSVMSSPKKRTRPAVGGKSPVTALKSVVLPAPLAPRMARRSPAATESETPSIARSAPNVRVTPSSTRASSDASERLRRDRRRPWAYGQAGLSRVPMPILSNSACERFRRWSTFSTRETTLL